jgi:phage terminase large subunit
MEVRFPEKLEFLISQPATIKVIWGGRGGAKTESVAIALIVHSIQKNLKIACFRELQKSINESVYSTLKNQIRDMGLENEFEILNKTIISKRTGSEFIFEGLRYNINSIKSMSRIDIAWVEEANNVSKTSWDKLIPTLRGRPNDDPNGRGGPFGLGPELIITFNPEMDTDETYKRFVLKRDDYAPDYVLNDRTGEKERYCICVKMNWYDNPFFPDDLRNKMNIDKTANPNKYLEVWEGHTKVVLDGAIYAEELRQVIAERRRGKVPYDPTRPVFTFWDLGHSDKTAIWFIQRVGLEYNIINFYQNNLKKLGHYLEYMQSLGYIYGTVYQPHDADNETLASRSIAKMTRDAGFTVRIVPKPAKRF